MKKYQLIVLLFGFWGCEDEFVINNNDNGVLLDWIGYDAGSFGSAYFTDIKPDVPQDFSFSQENNFYWSSTFYCVEIQFFQSEGYFNYRLSNEPDVFYTKELEPSYSYAWKIK